MRYNRKPKAKLPPKIYILWVEKDVNGTWNAEVTSGLSERQYIKCFARQTRNDAIQHCIRRARFWGHNGIMKVIGHRD